jgi:long-chain acyl-CoA synthetase
MTATLASLLFDADIPRERTLVSTATGSHTRAAVEQHARALHDALREAGVRPGTPVAVMLPNGSDVVAALFGTWSAGAVYVPLNPRSTDSEVARVLAAVRPAAIVTTAARCDAVRGRPVVIVHDDRWEVVHDDRPPEPAEYDADIALIQFTSGTTGRPKPVLLRHSGVLTLLDSIVRKLRRPGPRSGHAPAREPMPNLVPISMSLWAGIYQVLFAFRVGAGVVVMDRFDAKTFAEVVRSFGIRSTVLPPAAMVMLADDQSITDLTPLVYVRSITAPLSPFQARRFRKRFGVSVLNGYGQTELGGEVVGWDAADLKAWGDAKLGSVGRPHDGVAVQIVDDAGRPAAVDQPGEIWVRAPALAAGYAEGGDLSDRLTPDGWFRTGDVGRVDAEGFVWVEGRVSDMINRGGLKVFPDEVAEVLRVQPGVVDVAVVGVADERLGEVPWAFVVTDGSELDASALDAATRAQLAPYKVPVRYERIDALPRNEIGKVLVAALVDRARGERQRRP